ncbi:DNA polymerase IV [Enterocloster clostridioformis]|uniref:DNA polymerase Y family protein n=1 Tax=Enterocloster clostridioformis TaxID=1531 RepID=UPI00080C9DBA|nr:DNA polymerase IV [Enterocloster clostridioformis]ANU47453.1 DNA polymerase IV [Lachnoclostridium sp. YL32]NDO30918.1 DNA polymerase IV [Enterocloster clostridioformis]OXE66357.1 DNA polymerase IV [Enterocloster clostridioformis]QQR03650.1 DNA polymerase IV [Enterocloster clostridioformis]
MSLGRIIFHIDVNSAFLSWEAVYRLYHLGGKVDLREEVSAVGGDMAMRHGIIPAKSIPAKKYRIQTGESIMEALQKCPHLKLVPPNYGLYEKCSAAFMEILRQYSPCVEQYSVDEAFVDMTGTESLWGEPVTAANRIRNQIREELGFTVNVGVSENKLLAKMASDFKKPDRVHTLWKNELEMKMWPLPVSDLFFVGRATTKKLFNMGIHTIGELAKADPALLKSHLKKHGEVIWAFANGMDVSVVQSETPANKGYGNSTTIAFDVTDTSTAKLVLLALAETVGTRLRAAGVKAEVVAIGIKSHDLKYVSHQMTLTNATNITIEIHRCACQLFDALWDGTPIRHLGIHTSRLRDRMDMRQFDMFDTTDYEKLEHMDATVDKIRMRYGRDSLKRAVFVGSRIDHMSGGISREKRTVDYQKVKVE